MWLIFQLLVMFFVLKSNIDYHWTPNPYLAGVIAVIAAWIATKIVYWLLILVGAIKRHRPSRASAYELEHRGEPDSRDRLEQDRKSLLGYRDRREG